MISSVEIKNLKSIDYIKLEPKHLNIITGTNSSGKSTVLQAILLYFQTHSLFNQKNISSGLNGRYVSLGEFRENKNYNVLSDSIDINIIFDEYRDVESSISFKEETKILEDQKYGENSTDKECSRYDDCMDGFTDKLYNNDIAYTPIKYLSCNRIGAQDIYDKDYSLDDIGLNGEYAIYFLQKNKTKLLDKSLIKDLTSETLYTQVNYWLKYIIGATITTEDIQGTDLVKASYKVGDTRESRPKNVGSGISYLISILVLCLSANKDETLIIENPEIHLHPRAQSKLCEFLYFVSQAGMQIFIETHSDHIFNGIRAGIATAEMNADDIAVNFFELDDNNCTKNTVIEFGKRGKILNNVEGLFDQFNIDLNKMLNL